VQPSSPTFGPLVDAAWLVEHLADVVVCDIRWYLDGRSGRAAFELGHLPGARFVDLDVDLAAPPGGIDGRHPLPSPDRFADAMSQLGIGDDTRVVAYDDTGGSTAARLVWMLRALREPAALLDGGLTTWSGALETGAGATPRPGSFTPRQWPAEAFTDADALSAALARRDVVAIDARAGERYRGEIEPIDSRAGHVPGALNVPWATLVDRDTRRVRPPAELRAAFAAAGIDDRTAVVTYCGSGVNACFDALALEMAGLAPPKVFVASWSGWSSDPARPAATGAEPDGNPR